MVDSLVYGVALNPNSPHRDIYQLKYKFSIPEFWTLKTVLEAQSDIKNASVLDYEIQAQHAKGNK